MADGNLGLRASPYTRRGFLASALIWSSIAVSTRTHASDDYPPVFANLRHQFTLIEPAVSLPLVMLEDGEGRPAPVWHRPGRLALINIFAMWCVNCRTELPSLQRLFDAKKDTIDVLAICVDRSVHRQELTQYLSALDIRTLPVFQDPNGQLAGGAKSPLPVIGMPLTYVIRPNGTVAGYLAGEADWHSLDGQRLLSYFQSKR